MFGWVRVCLLSLVCLGSGGLCGICFGGGSLVFFFGFALPLDVCCCRCGGVSSSSRLSSWDEFSFDLESCFQKSMSSFVCWILVFVCSGGVLW